MLHVTKTHATNNERMLDTRYRRLVDAAGRAVEGGHPPGGVGTFSAPTPLPIYALPKNIGKTLPKVRVKPR
jgi:hypothetical protein